MKFIEQNRVAIPDVKFEKSIEVKALKNHRNVQIV